MITEAPCGSDSGSVSVSSLIGLAEKKFFIKDSLVIYTRSSHSEVFCKRSVFKNFAKFTGKHQCQSLFFNKVAGRNFIKKETLAQVFTCEFFEIFKNAFLCRPSPVAASVWKVCIL